jgi:hypothetical protein
LQSATAVITRLTEIRRKYRRERHTAGGTLVQRIEHALGADDDADVIGALQAKRLGRDSTRDRAASYTLD